MRIAWAALSVASIVSCGRAPAPGPFPSLAGNAGDGGVESTHPLDRDSHHAILDEEDRCRFIDGCAGGFFIDDDGCPDVAVSFAVGSARLDADAVALLDAIGDEIVGDGVVALMRVIGSSIPGEPAIAVQRAAVVRDHLVTRGVPPAIMVVEGVLSSPDMVGIVVFDVVSCLPP